MKEDSISVIEHTVCTCGSAEHTVEWMFVKEGEYAELYFNVHLSSDIGYRFPDWVPKKCTEILHYWFPRTSVVLYRLQHAIKYLFGYKSKYGDFDTFTLKFEDVDCMIEYFNRYKQELLKREDELEKENRYIQNVEYNEGNKTAIVSVKTYLGQIKKYEIRCE